MQPCHPSRSQTSRPPLQFSHGHGDPFLFRDPLEAQPDTVFPHEMAARFQAEQMRSRESTRGNNNPLLSYSCASKQLWPGVKAGVVVNREVNAHLASTCCKVVSGCVFRDEETLLTTGPTSHLQRKLVLSSRGEIRGEQNPRRCKVGKHRKDMLNLRHGNAFKAHPYRQGVGGG